MTVARACDMCDRPEKPGRFIQHYMMLPSRQVRDTGYQPRGRRSLDLCGECAEVWTHPLSVPVKPTDPTR